MVAEKIEPEKKLCSIAGSEKFGEALFSAL